MFLVFFVYCSCPRIRLLYSKALRHELYRNNHMINPALWMQVAPLCHNNAITTTNVNTTATAGGSRREEVEQGLVGAHPSCEQYL